MNNNKSKFLQNIKDQFTLLEEGDILDFSTEFKKLKAYDSMTALLIISMIDDEYSVAITGDDMRKITTFEDLYKLVFDSSI